MYNAFSAIVFVLRCTGMTVTPRVEQTKAKKKHFRPKLRTKGKNLLLKHIHLTSICGSQFINRSLTACLLHSMPEQEKSNVRLTATTIFLWRRGGQISSPCISWTFHGFRQSWRLLLGCRVLTSTMRYCYLEQLWGDCYWWAEKAGLRFSMNKIRSFLWKV